MVRFGVYYFVSFSKDVFYKTKAGVNRLRSVFRPARCMSNELRDLSPKFKVFATENFEEGINYNMARINIEDSLFKDTRYFDLLLKVGCKHKALGIVCGAWILAQKHWLADGNIPPRAWLADFDVLIDVQLAERHADGSVYIKGAKNAFAWLNQRSEAGKVGGKSKSEKAPNRNKRAKNLSVVKRDITGDNGTKRDVTEHNGSNRDETGAIGTKRDEASYSSSYSSSNSFSSSFSISDSNSNSSNNTLTKRKPKKDSAETELNRKIWQSYFDAYTLRYGVEPVRNGRINGQVAQLGKRLGIEAVDVVKFYLSHNDGFYLKNSHSIGLCLKDAESLHTQWKRGTKITGAKVREFEKQSQFMDTITDIRENGI